MIAGLEAADSGQILLGDVDVTNVLPKYRDVAMVFQSYALYPHKTVAENIGFPLKVRGMSPAERAPVVREAAAQVHMEGLLERYPRQLSGGQRQRVALARAIVRRPVGVPDGRAALQPRRQAARLHARRAQAHAARARRDDDLRDPRPGRGDDAGAPGRGDGPGRAAAGRHAARGLRPAGQPVRRRLHGLAADEPGRRPDRAAAVRERRHPPAARGRPRGARCGAGLSPGGCRDRRSGHGPVRCHRLCGRAHRRRHAGDDLARRRRAWR